MTKQKLVPVEPTEEMLDAAKNIYNGGPYNVGIGKDKAREIYKAMLAAAPASEPTDHLADPDSRERAAAACPTGRLIVSGEKASTPFTVSAPASETSRVLLDSDSYCPSCGHNRDASSVSSIRHDDGTRSCQMCGSVWGEMKPAPCSAAQWSTSTCCSAGTGGFITRNGSINATWIGRSDEQKNRGWYRAGGDARILRDLECCLWRKLQGYA